MKLKHDYYTTYELLKTWAEDYTGDPSYLRRWALNQPEDWKELLPGQ